MLVAIITALKPLLLKLGVGKLITLILGTAFMRMVISVCRISELEAKGRIEIILTTIKSVTAITLGLFGVIKLYTYVNSNYTYVSIGVLSKSLGLDDSDLLTIIKDNNIRSFETEDGLSIKSKDVEILKFLANKK